MSDLLPTVTGPKLFPCTFNVDQIRFIKLLGSTGETDSSTVAHSKVFEITYDGRKYVLKIVSAPADVE
jgi:hypothetical protein